MTINQETILPNIIFTALNAGKAIMEIYETDFGVEFKADKSPLTLADKKAHAVISKDLEKTGLPVLSEEGREINYDKRKSWNRFWMVDPLDGTKEFVKRNGEFTVNIALIENRIPVLGVVYAPVLDVLYFGSVETGAFMINNASKKMQENSVGNWKEIAVELPLQSKENVFKIVASRSHLSLETETFINDLKKTHPNAEIVSIGSSLKLCLIAEGNANVYPRFAPTMEWDTAAGHAIISAANGTVKKANDINIDLTYNKENLLNPWFIGSAKAQ